jgi:hypothetical protein
MPHGFEELSTPDVIALSGVVSVDHASNHLSSPSDAAPLNDDKGARQSTTATDYWTGRLVGDGLSMAGVGRGKPMGEGDSPQARFNDAFDGFGMARGRGRALVPPPGFGPPARRKQRAPGGLSQEWTPHGPSIPEEEELDPEFQELSHQNAEGLALFTIDVPSRFNSDDEDFDGYDRTPSVWSKATGNWTSAAGFCPTPSVWSRTSTPPGTPSMRPGLAPEYQQTGMPPGFAEVNAPGSTLSGCANALYNQHALGDYVWVPIARTHNCPHCGRDFLWQEDALSPKKIASRMSG